MAFSMQFISLPKIILNVKEHWEGEINAGGRIYSVIASIKVLRQWQEGKQIRIFYRSDKLLLSVFIVATRTRKEGEGAEERMRT